jgi:alkylation response protein AidB-like acyl-CoA dehydrogenase
MKQGTTFATVEVSRRRADDLIAWLRGYAKERINSRLIDERRSVPPYIILDFGNRGLMGMQVPEACGGLALRHVDHFRVIEQLAAIDQTLAAVVFVHGINGIRPIQYYGTDALRDELLPVLARGRELAAFALSEPVAGANVGGIASQARPDGRGGWRLRGVKRWNSSSWAGVTSVFAREVDDRGRAGGMSGFVVRQGAPGLHIGPEALTMGLRGSVQNSLFLDDVPVGPEQLLGERGRGMEVAEDALAIGRLCIAVVCSGALKRCAQLLGRYGRRRTVASGRLLANPLLLANLGELIALIDAVEALVDQIASRLDDGRPVPPEVPMAAKVIASGGLNWAAGQLMQFLGGRGYMENNLAPQILRDARLWSVGEGPSELLTIQVGRKARLTAALTGYLRDDPSGTSLADLIAGSVRPITERCVRSQGPFEDHSSAQLWADALFGQAVAQALLLAAVRQAHHTAPSDRLARAADWAEFQLTRTLKRAWEGDSLERLIPTSQGADAAIRSFADSIGDVEQTLPGEEITLDDFLCVTPGADFDTRATGLPGQAIVSTDAAAEPVRPNVTSRLHSAEEPARDRLESVLQQTSAPVAAGDSRT